MDRLYMRNVDRGLWVQALLYPLLGYGLLYLGLSEELSTVLSVLIAAAVPLAVFGPKNLQWKRDGLTVGGFLLFFIWIFGFNFLGGEVLSPLERLLAPGGVVDTATALEDTLLGGINGAVIVPLCEEVIFRGIALEVMRRRAGDHAAWWWSALLFAFMHHDPRQSLNALPAGLLLGAAYLKGGLLFSTLLHMATNFSVFLLDLAQARGPLWVTWVDRAGWCAAFFAIGVFLYLLLKGRRFGRRPSLPGGIGSLKILTAFQILVTMLLTIVPFFFVVD